MDGCGDEERLAVETVAIRYAEVGDFDAVGRNVLDGEAVGPDQLVVIVEYAVYSPELSGKSGV